MATLNKIDAPRGAELGRVVTQILNDWGIEPEHQVALLGLPPDTRPRALNRFRSGTPFPDDQECLLRAHYILSIQTAVESMYPHNISVGHLWVTTPNAMFSDKTPLEIMLLYGVDGMQRLVHHLNGTSEWG
jgi:hypothetical protein